MIILIDGLPASGKATLKGLLDGHSEIFTGYNHDMIADAVCDAEDENWLAYKDVMYLRSLLSTTHYYQLEYFAYKKSTVIVMKADQNNHFDINLDFYQMDRAFMKSILELPVWTHEIITTAIFRSMIEAGSYPKNKISIQHFASMGFNRRGICEKFIKAYSDGKILYVIRPLEQIVAVLANRVPIDDDMWSLVLLETTVKRLVKKGFIKKLQESERQIKIMAERYPDRIRLVQFEDLVLHTDQIMCDVADWLGVSYEEALRRCTLAGKEMLTDEGKPFTGEILDRVEEILRPEERALIAMEISLRNTWKNKNYRYPRELAYVLVTRAGRFLRRTSDRILSLLSSKYRQACNAEWQRNGFW